MRFSFHSAIAATIITSIFGAIFLSPFADAQQPQRREFIQGLLKELIESQVEQAQNRNRGQQQYPQQYPQGRLPDVRLKPRKVPVRPQPRPVQPVTTSPRVIQVRKQLTTMSSRCDDIIESFRVHEQKVPRLRVLLADCLQLKASIDTLARQSQTCVTVEPLTQGYASIDRDWRLVQNRLSHVRGLPVQCQQRIDAFRTTETAICETLEIEPQVNRVELIRLATALATNIEHLVQDIQYDLRTDPQYRPIMAQGQNVYSILSQAGPVVQYGTYDEIVGTFKTGTAEWRKFTASLRGHRTPRLNQDIQRIETISTQIRELLWLPYELDRDYLCDVIGTIEKRSNQMLSGVTVADLLQCKQPGLVMASARDFQTRCTEFSAGVRGDMSIDELAWQYQDFQNRWQGLRTNLVQFTRPTIEAGCDQIDGSLVILRENFGDGPVINRDTMLAICRDLDNYSRQLSGSIHKRVTRKAYKDLHGEICPCSSDLHKQCHQLHEHVIRSRNGQYDVEKFAAPVFQQWTTLKPLLNKCKDEDRVQFMTIRRQIEPLMVKLQVVYAN